MTMNERTVLRYRLRSRVLHWLHSLAFVILFLTGLLRFVHPAWPGVLHLAAGLHRGGAILFIAVPLLYVIIWPQPVKLFFDSLFRWHRSDWNWLKTAPGYYFGGSDRGMPDQEYFDPGQRAWEMVVFIGSVVFILTGLPLWLLKFEISPVVYQWLSVIHALVFIVTGLFFLLHLYLGLFHPRFRESWRSMIDGRISPRYAHSHYRKWYDEDKKG
jgi:formate dehydrogenase subunit gamma